MNKKTLISLLGTSAIFATALVTLSINAETKLNPILEQNHGHSSETGHSHSDLDGHASEECKTACEEAEKKTLGAPHADEAKNLDGHKDEACKTACEEAEKVSFDGHASEECKTACEEAEKKDDLAGHKDEACKTACESAEADAHAGHDHASHEGHDHAAEEGAIDGPVISPLALKNLGVKFATLKKDERIIYTRVPAVVRSPETNHKVLYSPWSGRVKSIDAAIGQKAAKDKVLVEIIRDPLPRVELRMTENLLKLASEEFHTSLAEYKKSMAVLKIYKDELKRLSDFQKKAGADAPIVPRKELINLKYEITKAEQDVKNTEEKLKLHGTSQENLDRIKKGAHLHVDHSFWLNSLKANGLWGADAEKLFNSLPEKMQKRSWVIPSIAELSSQDFITENLITTVKLNKTLANNFIEVAGLVQEGYSVEQLLDLADRKAFDKIMKLSFPKDADITSINIRRGQKVEVGAELISLRDPSQMYLEVQALGSEKAEVKKALAQQWNVGAQAITDKSITAFKGLKISHLQEDPKASRLLKAIVPVPNRLISEAKRSKSTYRSWELQDGLRFYLQIPRAVHKGAFEVPASAILESGPDTIVIVKEGDIYYERPVHVAYSNDDRAILTAASELRVNEQVVANGAFALQLALAKSKGLVIDTRCAHSH